MAMNRQTRPDYLMIPGLILLVLVSVVLISLPQVQAGELNAKQLQNLWGDQFKRPGATICLGAYVMDENRIDNGKLSTGEMALHRPNLYPISDLVDDPDSTDPDTPWWLLTEPRQGSLFYSKGWLIFNKDMVLDFAREVGNTFSCQTCYGGGTVRKGFKVEVSGMIMSAFPPKLEIKAIRSPDPTEQIPECAWFNSVAPTDFPTPIPTPRPTLRPTRPPTNPPTAPPTGSPTNPLPTTSPTLPLPPSKPPTPLPTTPLPTPLPTLPPSTPPPTPFPTLPPTPYPTPLPTLWPTPNPTLWPTPYPTPLPTLWPTPLPTPLPTPGPTQPPTKNPTPGPTQKPSPLPSSEPSSSPVESPSTMPSFAPTVTPPVNCSEYQKIYKVPNLPLWIHWVVNIDDTNSTRSTLSAQIVYDGQGWIGFGVSPTRQMNGSSVIVGSVGHTSDFVNPGKFYLGGRGTSFISVMEKQTLQNATIEQNATHTVMKFTKILEEEGEPRIDGRGRNTFIAAHGFNNQFAYHAGRIVFDMVLTPCIPPAPLQPILPNLRPAQPIQPVRPVQPVQQVQPAQPIQEEEKPDLFDHFDHFVYVNFTVNATAANATPEEGILTVATPEAVMDTDPIPFEEYASGGVAVSDTSVYNPAIAVLGRTSGGGASAAPADKFANSGAGDDRGDASSASDARAAITLSFLTTASTLIGLAYLVVTGPS